MNIHSVKNAIKALVKHDDLPTGKDIPTVQTINALNDRYSFSSLLPYERYDEDTGVYFNKDTLGFMLHCAPSTGLVNENIAVLNGIFRNIYTPETTIQINIISDSNIEYILKNWAFSGCRS
jgi:conjugal transfer ATP-binding protein TraC